MRRLPLRRRDGSLRGYALVDDADFEAFDLGSMKWSLSGNGYVQSNRRVSLHRLLMGFPASQVDHRNLNRLDNRRENLRVATNAQNGQNRRLYANNTSGYRGVTQLRGSGKWVAQAHLNGRRFYLGCYDEIEDAANVASAFRAEHMPYSEEAACRS